MQRPGKPYQNEGWHLDIPSREEKKEVFDHENILNFKVESLEWKKIEINFNIYVVS